MHVDQDQAIICKKAFCSLHGISSNRVDRIAAHAAVNITSPPDLRGRHGKHRQVSEEIRAQIDEHIKSFPRRRSHYGRNDNAKKYYLSAELNISKMHMLYLQKYEPENFLVIESGRPCRPVVKYDFYSLYFKTHYNISFGSPRVDTCETCDRLFNETQSATEDDQKKRLKLEKDLHVRKAEAFYTVLREKSALAKDDAATETLCFDFQQNLPLPHVPAGDVFYKRQLWVFNFGIHSASTGKTTCYVYDEMTGKKGANEVVSFLNHYVENFLPSTVTTLNLFSDNCAAQNKNNVMVQNLFVLAAKQRFQNITHHFPLPGHSFLPCDRSFGLIEQEKRKRERVHTPEEWERLVTATSRKFAVVSVKQEMILDYASVFGPNFKKNLTNRRREKFSISKYRVFEYSFKHFRVVRCSIGRNLDVHSDFAIERPGVSAGSLPEEVQPLYSGVLHIKANKVKDVKSLVQKYVPLADHWYYNQMRSERESVVDESDENVENKTDADSDSDVD